MSVFKFGIVGCGRIAKRHSEILGNGLIDGAHLSAVCDVQTERADEMAQKFRVKAYYSLEDMLKSSEVDVVSILTPSGMHAEHQLSGCEDRHTDGQHRIDNLRSSGEQLLRSHN